LAERFSNRHGYKKTPDVLVRNDAPKELREALRSVFRDLGYEPQEVGEWICHLKHQIPEEQLGTDPDWYVVSLMMENLRWYEVYDLLEKMCPKGISGKPFEEQVNSLFEEFAIGWKLADGAVEDRGDDAHDRLTRSAIDALATTGRLTAASEMKKAIEALSRRPDADTRGAVTRAIGALEALARDLAKDPTATLGQIVPRLPLPRPLDQSVSKLWGFASDRARHVREGQMIALKEAYLVVDLCSALASFLSNLDRL